MMHEWSPDSSTTSKVGDMVVLDYNLKMRVILELKNLEGFTYKTVGQTLLEVKLAFSSKQLLVIIVTKCCLCYCFMFNNSTDFQNPTSYRMIHLLGKNILEGELEVEETEFNDFCKIVHNHLSQ